MSAIEYIRPRIRIDLPAFLVGSLYAYEDVLGTFSGLVVVKPAWSGPPLNAIALTSERLVAFDIHGVTESTFSLPLSTVTAMSSPEDAATGRVSALSAQAELHIAELAPEDATFSQSIVYNAAAGRLYRVGQPDTGDR